MPGAAELHGQQRRLRLGSSLRPLLGGISAQPRKKKDWQPEYSCPIGLSLEDPKAVRTLRIPENLQQHCRGDHYDTRTLGGL